MILSCDKIEKSFGGDVILSEISFHINQNDRLAIVGNNGAGKSTLLKIIMKEYDTDFGEVVLAKGATLGYLAQHQDLSFKNTIFDELLSVRRHVLELEETIRSTELKMKEASEEELETLYKTYHNAVHAFEQENGYALKSEITGVLMGLGFTEDEFSKNAATLSGGQKTRVSLAKLLLSSPSVILLDEPTNHLDLKSTLWLENYLCNYKGTVIVVSHDRYFLDKFSNKVLEIENHRARLFEGNYSAYLEKKLLVVNSLMKQYMNQQREIKRQQEVITKLKSFNREKSIKRAESRQKMLDKIEVIERPVDENDSMNLRLEPWIESGKDVLRVMGLKKSFSNTCLFSGLDFEIKRGERVALIGDNGTGKTTILKIINDIIAADEGSISLGAKVYTGYYDQEQQQFDMGRSLFDEIRETYPDMDNTSIRNTCAAFLFTEDDVFKKIGELSGGERGRLSLLKLMLSKANFLILDEPTNHLDITSKEILENALNHYTGTVLFVSHDRFFINRTATRVLELSGGNLYNYLGNYDYYMEKKSEGGAWLANGQGKGGSSNSSEGSKSDGNLNTKMVSGGADASSAVSQGSADWKKQKGERARLRKRENELKRCEERIEVLEKENEEIDFELAKEEVYTNPARLMELTERKQQIEGELEGLMERWEELLEGENN